MVNDKPNPFWDGADDPVAFLGGRRPDNIVPMPPPRARFSATDMVGHMFQTVRQAATDAEPGLAVFGQGDDLDDGQRAERIRRCLRKNRLFAVIYPIDNIASFLGVHGEGRYGSVAIVARDLQHLVVAVSAGPTLAVAQPGELLIAQDDGPLLRPSQSVGGPILPGSYVLLSAPEPGGTACQAGCPRTALCGTALPEPANPILLNAILLGGVEAGVPAGLRPMGRGRELPGRHRRAGDPRRRPRQEAEVPAPGTRPDRPRPAQRRTDAQPHRGARRPLRPEAARPGTRVRQRMTLCPHPPDA